MFVYPKDCKMQRFDDHIRMGYESAPAHKNNFFSILPQLLFFEKAPRSSCVRGFYE